MGAARVHPETEIAAWHNHLSVLHESAWREGFAIAARRHEREGYRLAAWRFLVRSAICTVVDAVERAVLGLAGLGQHVTHADGGEIAAKDLAHFRRLVSHHTRCFAHLQGDIDVIDNMRIAHSRAAFDEWSGRKLLAAWTGGYGEGK